MAKASKVFEQPLAFAVRWEPLESSEGHRAVGDLHFSRTAGCCIDRLWGHKQRSSAWTAQSRGIAVTQGAVKELVAVRKEFKGV